MELVQDGSSLAEAEDLNWETSLSSGKLQAAATAKSKA
jgi:hypothetical protein